MKICLLAFLCLPIFSAANFNEPAGARSTALGGNSSAISDVYAVHNNQAGIGFLKKFSFAIDTRNKFLIKELTVSKASAVFPTKTGVFGLGIHYSGTNLFSEKKIGAAFAKSFGEKFSAGLQFDYLNISVSEYGTRNFFTFEVGAQYYILKQLLIGAHLNNPLRISVNDESDEKLPTIMKFGFNYMPSHKVSLLAEVEKDLEFDPVLKFGVEYLPSEKFALRGGFTANPVQASFGAGILLKKIVIDASSVFHPVLGFSPHIAIAYVFSKK